MLAKLDPNQSFLNIFSFSHNVKDIEKKMKQLQNS